MRFLDKYLIGSRIAIDLGTSNTLVYRVGEGVVFNEPSVVALGTRSNALIALGHEAKKMIGRTPAHLTTVKPLSGGVISDFEATTALLQAVIKRHNKSVFGPLLTIGIPPEITEVQKKAVLDAARIAGAHAVYLVNEQIAAALGGGLHIEESQGVLIIDIGGGTTDIAVVSLGGLVAARSLKVAGEKFNQDVADYARDHLKLIISHEEAERAKILFSGDHKIDKTPLKGRDVITGLPKQMYLTREQAGESLEDSVSFLIQNIKDFINALQPEITSDILTQGIYLVGGGAYLMNLRETVSRETRLDVRIIEDPLTAVCRGLGFVAENFPHTEKYTEVI